MKTSYIIFISLALISFAACTDIAKEPVVEEQGVQEPPIVNVSSVTPSTLPSFNMIHSDGSTINLADLKGKKVFVNLWATWCPPCRAEIPSIEKLYSKVDKQKTVFIMLSLDESFDLATQFAQAKKMKLPVYAPAGNLPEMFNVNGIPTTFIFNENGELIKKNTGMDDYDTDAYVELLK